MVGARIILILRLVPFKGHSINCDKSAVLFLNKMLELVCKV